MKNGKQKREHKTRVSDMTSGTWPVAKGGPTAREGGDPPPLGCFRCPLGDSLIFGWFSVPFGRPCCPLLIPKGA